ncbi:MAG: response regulator transcription factor [Lachnospiraceae bacterium]|nr:response regulator transcription factor [Lachnospiraceae bacterium]
MQYQVLIVDDEKDLAKMTAEYLQMFDISTACVYSAAECYDFFAANSAELILLDINLEDGSGFAVCKKLRGEYNLPILFISARQSDDDVLAALTIGGDDYIKKPYSLSVLLAKVKVNLKRVAELRAAEQGATAVTVNGASTATTAGNGSGADTTMADAGTTAKNAILTLDAATMSAVRNGRRVPLKAKEFALLHCLYERRNTIVTKEVLFDEVWGDAFYSDGTLNVHIRKLREKLEDDPNAPTLIKTVWGTGYILEV